MATCLATLGINSIPYYAEFNQIFENSNRPQAISPLVKVAGSTSWWRESFVAHERERDKLKGRKPTKDSSRIENSVSVKLHAFPTNGNREIEPPPPALRLTGANP